MGKHYIFSDMVIGELVVVDKYIEQRSPAVDISNNPRLTICELGWYTFSANAKWVIINYDKFEVVPYSQIAFTMRYLLEIVSDYDYILSSDTDSRLNAFLKQHRTSFSLGRKGMNYFEDITNPKFMHDAKINCEKNEKEDKILKRIERIFQERGIGNYNLDSSCCHCNYCGMLVAANANSEDGLVLRSDTIQILPLALSKNATRAIVRR